MANINATQVKRAAILISVLEDLRDLKEYHIIQERVVKLVVFGTHEDDGSMYGGVSLPDDIAEEINRWLNKRVENELGMLGVITDSEDWVCEGIDRG